MSKVVNILGCGVMGRQIGALLSCINYDVRIYDRSINDQKKKLFSLSQKIIKRKVNLNKEPSTPLFTNNIQALEPALIIESITEDLEAKRGLISKFEFEIKKGQLLSNSSSLLPSEIHQNAVGFHFFNPIHVIKLIEFSSKFEVEYIPLKILIQDLKDTLGYDVVTVKENRGFVANYILFNEIANTLKLIDLYGYSPSDIEKVSSYMGKSYSIFEIIDLVGVDVTKNIIESLMKESPSVYLSPSLNNAIAGGILGKKNKTSFREFIS